LSGQELAIEIASACSIFLLAGSLIFWGQGIQRLLQGQRMIPYWYHSIRAVHIPRGAVIFALLWLALIAVQSRQGSDQTPELPSLERVRAVLLDTVITGMILIPALLASLFWRIRSRADLARIGLRQDHLDQQFRDGAWGLLIAALPVALLLMMTASLRTEETQHPYLRLLQATASPTDLLMIVLAAVVVAPLLEELLFRVILQSWLSEWFSPGAAIVLSSLLFGAVHGFPDCIPIFGLALVLGTIYQRRSSYLAVVVLHALFNAYNLAITFLS
jgi:membrane protease YdiL (CAAX protease family)